MRTPWVSLGASALLVVLATALLSMEHGRPQALPAGETAELRSGFAPGSVRTAQDELIIPVAGVVGRDLADTWGQARSEGRRHEGIDILAPRDTQVLAAADGRIVKFFDSVRGGITIYQFDRNQRFVYYYAHLNARAAGLHEGDAVRQGQLIGYVGMTGNAPVTHLHFEIQRLGPERKWWRAESINPYPFLIAGRAPA